MKGQGGSFLCKEITVFEGMKHDSAKFVNSALHICPKKADSSVGSFKETNAQNTQIQIDRVQNILRCQKLFIYGSSKKQKSLY